MVALESICQTLAEIAPLRLAEDWDNVGLLVGNRRATVRAVMTCLTISPAVVEESIREAVDLVVTHHPLPFKSLQRITTDTVTGSMLLELIRGGVAIYSAHTAFDSAAEGINQRWAKRLNLTDVQPLVPADEESSLGAGRYGRLPAPVSLSDLVGTAARAVGANCPCRVGDPGKSVTLVAVACGSGGSFLAAAARQGCDALITGEATFHTCLEAESLGIGLGLLGHYWSERFAMEQLAQALQLEYENLSIWPSRAERDPIAPLT